MTKRIIYFLILLTLAIPIVNAEYVDTIKNSYEDFEGNSWYVDEINLSAHPVYSVTDNGEAYTITRQGTDITLPIRPWISYQFKSFSIIPSYTISNFSQINQLVTKVTPSIWYLTVPWSATRVKETRDDLIDMGVFRRTTGLTVKDANNITYNILPKVISGDIRLYFNPQNYSNVTWPLILTEHTVTVVSGASTTNDTYVLSTDASTNFGNELDIITDRYGSSDLYKTLIKFNLTSIPSNANISSATFDFRLNSATTSNTMKIYRINTAWGELQATWNNQPTYGNLVATKTGLTSAGWYSADVKDFVKSVINGSATNNGFMLNSTLVDDSLAIDSSESTTVPSMTITYTIDNSIIPPTPVISTIITGNFYVNTTWTAGSGNVTNGYNSTNGTTWINNTLPYRNTTLSAHSWQNMTIYAFNATYQNLSLSPLTSNTQIPNSIPVIADITIHPSPAYNTDNLTTTVNVTDADSDTLSYTYRWYINSTLNSTWNNWTIVNSSNLTTDAQIYAAVNVSDGYNTSSTVQSNTLIIGSSNIAPTILGISLNPASKKFNRSIYVNSTNNLTDDGTLVRMQVYYKPTTDTKTFLGNSTWLSQPSNASVNITIPWSDGITHSIYARAEDTTNLTSGEVYETFTSDITPPSVLTSSLSAASIYTGVHVKINMTTSLSNGTVSNVSVHVSRPDTASSDYVMITSDNITWNYTYTGTADTGSYYIEYFGMTDDSGNRRTETSSLTFTASTEVITGGSGGGGGGGATTVIIKTDDANATQQLLTFTNLTSGEGLKTLNELGLCFTSGLLLTNRCAQSSISIVDEPVNWWTLIGAYMGSAFVLFIIALRNDEKKQFLGNIMLYGSSAWVMVVMLSFAGVNLYILNYAFNSPLGGLMFGSFAMWGGLVTVIGDSYSSYKRRVKKKSI